MSGIEALFTNNTGMHGDMTSSLLFTILIAFIVGQLNAWCFMWTHRGVSYSRSFTQSIILITIVTAFSMSLVKTNVVAAFGLLGGLSIIRFRTVVRDTRDTVYILLALVSGMATGFGFHLAAILGVGAVNLVSMYLFHTGFGGRQSQDGLLRFQAATAVFDSGALGQILERFCKRHTVISVDDVPAIGDGESLCQGTYKVRMRDPQQAPNFVSALKSALGIDMVHFLVQQENEDVA